MMEDKESPADIEESEGQTKFDQQALIVGSQRPLSTESGAMAAASKKSLEGHEKNPEQRASASGMHKCASVGGYGAFSIANEKEDMPHVFPGTFSVGNLSFGEGITGQLQTAGSTDRATSYQEFSRALHQNMKEADAGSGREWRFSFTDSRMPLSQINLASHSSGGWAVFLSAGHFDREVLARRLDDLQIKLARLNRNVEGIEIVGERRR